MADRENTLFSRLLDIIRTLRIECPWDSVQTHASLAPLLLDECYELKEAVEKGDSEGVEEELGDILILVLLMAEIARQEGGFKLTGVLKRTTDKLERRHPHIFGDAKAEKAEEVVELWGEIKREEKGESILKGIPKALPALRRANLIQQRASRVGFDWENLEGVLKKLAEESEELKKAKSKEEIEDELGDMLFILAHLGNTLGVDPEEALSRVCDKFVTRFSKVEEALRKEGRSPKDATLEEMDRIWDRVKEEDG